MTTTKPVPTLVIYRLKKDAEAEFKPLLAKHWTTLQKVQLAGPNDPLYWRALGRDGKLAYVELFEWKDDASSDAAHQTPEVMSIWEPMGPLLEGLEILKVEAVKL